MYDTHVYLGPSLDITTAKEQLPQAHYHPPVKCGDIIRLLRLEPKKIIIIDGLYENVPAVWHKEILLALELNIEVWGAASMGALRAAELNSCGMQGFGQIYQDFKTGKLNDDDEVAVLHQGQHTNFTSINDAMVNIRATCEQAWNEKIISSGEKNKLIHHCKKQFYPYRSLKQAAKLLSLKKFMSWLDTHGIIDIKKADAIAVLKHNKNLSRTTTSQHNTPRSYFFNELIRYANLTPFDQPATWLPPIEKELQSLHTHLPSHYMLVAELAFFTQKLSRFISKIQTPMNHDALLGHIKQHKLYCPQSDFKTYQTHPTLSSVYVLICQSIHLNNITDDTINHLLPAISHYYDIDQNTAMHCKKTLRSLLIIDLSINFYQNSLNTRPQKHAISNYLAELQTHRNYNQTKFKHWLNPTHFSSQYFKYFLGIYLNIVAYPEKKSDNIKTCQNYFKWIYDAYTAYNHHYSARSEKYAI